MGKSGAVAMYDEHKDDRDNGEDGGNIIVHSFVVDLPTFNCTRLIEANLQNSPIKNANPLFPPF